MITYGETADFSKAVVGDTFWLQVCPDGVNCFPSTQSRVVRVSRHWGMRDVDIECENGVNMTMTVAANWFGYLRLWIDHNIVGRSKYLWHTWKTRLIRR